MTANRGSAKITLQLLNALATLATLVALPPAPPALAAIGSAVLSPVYGQDDRQDLHEVSDPQLLAYADSTVVLLPFAELEPTGAGYRASRSRSLRGRSQTCVRERFAEQISISAEACSGALVGPDLVLTAGHCVTDQGACDGLAIAFGFGIREEYGGAHSSEPDEEPLLPVSEVYRCKKLVAGSFDDDLGYKPDFAVLRLDRKVTNHKPLKTAGKARVQDGTPLAVIGHPVGLPTKVAAGAFARGTDSDTHHFQSDLDTYYGSSGSPVFNLRTGLIEGILVDGADDFERGRPGEFDISSECRVSKRCTLGATGCLGEKVTRIDAAAPYIPAIK